jgi:hypothetical protein
MRVPLTTTGFAGHALHRAPLLPLAALALVPSGAHAQANTQKYNRSRTVIVRLPGVTEAGPPSARAPRCPARGRARPHRFTQDLNAP